MKGVEIRGRNIASTWWGRKWCENIERFADWSNRLPRGRAYCRDGHIKDLDLEHHGSVRALVAGSHGSPYRVTVQIAPLSVGSFSELVSRCSDRMENISELLEGRFPRDLEELFIKTLFPSRDEIRYSCSCPDWASLCKHIAAAMYGIGRRLDDDPGLIFSLRGIDLDLFSERIIGRGADRLWDKLSLPHDSGRIIPDSELGRLFGVDMAEETDLCLPAPASASRSALRLDRQTFIYSDSQYHASAFLRDGRIVLSTGAKVSRISKRRCPEHIALMRRESGVEEPGSDGRLSGPVMLDSIDDATSFIRGTEGDPSPWHTVFGVSYEETMRQQALLDESSS